MTRSWSFGRKVGAGFAVTVAFSVLIAAVAVYALRTVVAAKDRVIEVNARNLIDAQELEAVINGKTAASRAFLLDRSEQSLERMQEYRRNAIELLGRLRTQTYTEEGRRIVDRIERAEADHQAAIDKAIAARRGDAPIEAVIRLFEDEATPRRDVLRREVESLVARDERLLEDEKRAATDAAATAVAAVVATAVAAVLFALAVAVLLTRALGRQIGGAVQHIQSSSAELQAAANQQAAGAKEQATAMNEIATTISELLATSRQIAESAQRVAHIAEETARAARAGDHTVHTGQEAVTGIRRQVDQVVTHMLDLGRKAQQISGILEIITELAEQTNILAINAGIEAAGAGEAGKRFAVVADEIRKLADRVAGSAKEIRPLVEETRAAVSTTVMATEGGQKAVEAGARQFAEVAAAFAQIGELVRTSTEAAREIELSTRQQATAVQQVNAAIADVAQSTRETESSSSQTLQTATALTGLSRDLTRFVQPAAA